MKGKLLPCWFIGLSLLMHGTKFPASGRVLEDSNPGTVVQIFISMVLFLYCLLSDNLKQETWPWLYKECITFRFSISPPSLTFLWMKWLKQEAPCGYIRHFQPLLCKLLYNVHAQAEIMLLQRIPDSCISKEIQRSGMKNILITG